MFDLEEKILEWRQQMLAAGINSPGALEELESHLREDFERQMKSGLNGERAFTTAVRHIGLGTMLKQEFNKVERTLMKRTLFILAGTLAVLCGIAFILPALHLYNEQERMVHDAAVGFLIGIPIVLAGVGSAAYGLRQRII